MKTVTSEPTKRELEIRIRALVTYCHDRQEFVTNVNITGIFIGMLGLLTMAVSGVVNSITGLSFALLLLVASILLYAVIQKFDLNELEFRHICLKGKLLSLLREINSGMGAADAKILLDKLQDDFPAIFYASYAIALHESRKFYGEESTLTISPWQRRVRNLWRFDPTTFKLTP